MPFKCPECGKEIGGDTGTDIYKHAITCLHIEDKGIDQVLSTYSGEDDEHSKRVVAVMNAAKREKQGGRGYD